MPLRHRIALGSFALLAALTAASLLYASDGSSVATTATQTITAHGVCKKVTNSSSTGKTVYVPTQSVAEWASFYTNPPAGITLGSCCDTIITDMQNPDYALGSIAGQHGWSDRTNSNIDQAVVNNTYGFATFGPKLLRMSNAWTTDGFDQVYMPRMANAVGETLAQKHFEYSFDFASAVPTAQQSGLQVAVSPDDGGGGRMSYLKLTDESGGISIYFSNASFRLSRIARNVNRAVPHRIKLTLDAVPGRSNDIVRVYLDGALIHTDTSWENYFSSPPPVRTILFHVRSQQGAAPATRGKGFLFDNLALTSSSEPACQVP
jgi:hypothetical protein